MARRTTAIIAGLLLGGFLFGVMALLRKRLAPRAIATMAPATESWARCGMSVAHALGGIDSLLYTDAREAFERNYARGFRVFEIDLRPTRDGVLVAAHDWWTPARTPEFAGQPTLAEFERSRIYGRFSPLTARQALALLVTYPDARLVLDPKNGIQHTLPTVVQNAQSIDPKILDRVVPQIWNPEDVAVVRRLYPFASIIWSLHYTSLSDTAILDAVKRYRINIVTMHQFRFTPAFARQLRALGVSVYITTINTQPQASLYKSWGASGVYTDFLPPDSLCSR